MQIIIFLFSIVVLIFLLLQNVLDVMIKKKNKLKKLKKYHKWPGLIIALFLIYYAFSGILMNHRSAISGIDINRKYLPKDYTYKNWNLAALKGSEQLSQDSILVYGNIGVWLTDSSFSQFTDFNEGFPKGTDNRKTFDVLKTENNLYAATLFGLYSYDSKESLWKKFKIDVDIERFVALEQKGDSIIAMNRSYVFVGIDNGIDTEFEKIELKAPNDYKNEVSLFETVWQIHSGEIFGLPGKLFVDLLGIIVIIISITGIIYFFFPNLIKRRKRKEKSIQKLSSTLKFSLNWHNKIGAWTLAFLIILFFSGMFLRPPLLLTIARADIPAIKFTHLDQTNPWYDDLRDIVYDDDKSLFLLAGYNGIYELENLNTIPRIYNSQPPVSVMGINVFEKFGKEGFLVGSFSGLFVWYPNQGFIFDYFTRKPYMHNASGRPFGANAISGFIKEGNFIVDYANGIYSLAGNIFPEMPPEIHNKSHMSLWNLCLEIHTGRIFHFALGDFYILIVPLSGIFSLIVLISGYLIYRKRKKART